MTGTNLAAPKTRARRTILDRGRFLRVELHQVEWPNGKIIDDWAWIITPDYVNIVTETEDGRLLCFRQVKYAVDRIAWLYENRRLVGGLEFVEEPAVLRFFYGRLGAKSDWQDRLAAKFRDDFGDSL